MDRIFIPIYSFTNNSVIITVGQVQTYAPPSKQTPEKAGVTRITITDTSYAQGFDGGLFETIVPLIMARRPV